MSRIEDMSDEELRQDFWRWKMRKKYGPGIDTIKRFAKGKRGWQEHMRIKEEERKSGKTTKGSSCCVVPILIILLLFSASMF